MSWLSLLNPMNWIKLLSLIKFFWEGISKAIQAIQESRAKKADQENSDKAIEELKKPQDETKPVEELKKEKEGRWDDFFNSNRK